MLFSYDSLVGSTLLFFRNPYILFILVAELVISVWVLGNKGMKKDYLWSYAGEVGLKQ